MSYKSIVNKLDKFLIKKSDTNLECDGCPIDMLEEADSFFAKRLRTEFNIKSDCIINFFYSIKEILSEDRMNFLLEKIKENEIQFINCGYKRRSSRFIKVLKNTCVDLLEIE